MMNSHFYKLFFLLFITSCSTQTYVYEQIDYRGDIFYNDIKKMKTGSFYFPNMNFRYNLKKGKLDGKILLINKVDTILYGNFNKNLPIGRYINRLYNCEKCRSIFRGTIIEKYSGEGSFDKNSKKIGYWFERDQEGFYINGKKNGKWKIYQNNDLEFSKNSIKEVIYKDDLIIEK